MNNIQSVLYSQTSID